MAFYYKKGSDKWNTWAREECNYTQMLSLCNEQVDIVNHHFFCTVNGHIDYGNFWSTWGKFSGWCQEE